MCIQNVQCTLMKKERIYEWLHMPKPIFKHEFAMKTAIEEEMGLLQKEDIQMGDKTQILFSFQIGIKKMYHLDLLGSLEIEIDFLDLEQQYTNSQTPDLATIYYILLIV